MQFLGKPTRRVEAQREELIPRPGSQRQEGCFWQEEREVLGPEMGQYLGTTAILYEPRGRVEAWQRVAEAGHPRAGPCTPRTARPLALWTGLDASRAPHPPPLRLLRAGPGKAADGRGCPFKSASRRLPSRPGAGAAAPTSKPGAPSQIRLRKGRASRGGRQVSADSPFIPWLGGRGPPGGPARPCWASPRRAASCAAGPGGAVWPRAGPCPSPCLGHLPPCPGGLGAGPSREGPSGKFWKFGSPRWGGEPGLAEAHLRLAPARVRGRAVSETPCSVPTLRPPPPPSAGRALWPQLPRCSREQRLLVLPHGGG